VQLGTIDSAGTDERATVLVVDDDPRNRALLRGWLEVRYRVEDANDGASGIARIDRGGIDAVILDLMMPGMSGIDVLRHLRGGTGPASHPTQLPILLLTALGEQDVRNEALAAGASDFLTKPVDRRELNLRLAAFLRIQRQERTILRQLGDLERLDGLKDDLVSLLVHDLRNPLAGMTMMLDFVKMQAPPGLERELQALSHGAARLRVLIDDLLQIRALEIGSLKLNRLPNSLSAATEPAIIAMLSGASAREITVKSTIHRDNPLSHDTALVRRCVENLLANAIRFAPSGSEIVVSVDCDGMEGRIEVSDAGPGVPHEVRERIFAKFGSVFASAPDERRGYGLGLHLVGLVATAHQGRAEIVDRDGGGSVMRMVLAGAGE
jgi:two-component system sensor histidine kinase/response regulator